jgi:transcription initiation factor IIE alpha subunit
MLGSRVTCPDCGAVLEVVEEDRLELEEVFEEYGEGEEEIL